LENSSGIGDGARRESFLARHRRPLPICQVEVAGDADATALSEREWLLTNGLGGYSSGTVPGFPTRRYHGLLVAALPNPIGRMVMLTAVDESLDPTWFREFYLDGGIPVWRYDVPGGGGIEKRVFMPYRQNTTILEYRATGTRPITLRLTPAVDFRPYEAPLAEKAHDEYRLTSKDDHFLITAGDLPPLKLALDGRFSFVVNTARRDQVHYPIEEARGYAFRGALWLPGSFVVELEPGEHASLIASTETVDTMLAMRAPEALAIEQERKQRLLDGAGVRDATSAQLVIAADQFVIRPVGRVRDSIRASALGEELRTVIAGYHWFTDWGRDTMISLDGLTLTTGRHREAGFILRTFSHYVRDGLIPNLFPDGSDQGLYHTADATLWFFHALERYGQVTGYWSLVEQLLPVMRAIADAHIAGTKFGIGVDASDGLLRQGAEGYQLTWMDAKVDDWVVTPRRGKAVEINALWYNALMLLQRWECDLGDPARSRLYKEQAERARESFNDRFWFSAGGHLYDVVDGPEGDDPACRPNQLFSISLPHPVLDESRWAAVLGVVEKRLLTPVGLRSLSPDHQNYKQRYFGDLRARDAAYHQGTVWAWLIGPWIDAWLKVHPEDHRGARRFLEGLVAHLPEFGVGSIAEVFDAEPPFTPRGCAAQAWSVAEVLRCWEKTA
jgi:predicted glycogen debranching enzyme